MAAAPPEDLLPHLPGGVLVARGDQELGHGTETVAEEPDEANAGQTVLMQRGERHERSG